MGTPKVDKAKLKELHDRGITAAQIARQFGVSKAAISKALKAMGKAVNSHVAIEKAKKVVDRKMVTIEQLQKINDYANELLDLVMRWNRGEDVALQILEKQARKIKIGKGDNVQWITEYKFKDPREIGLRAMQEIREQLKLQMEMYKTLFDLKANAEFQQELIALLGDIDTNVRDEFVRRLEKKQLIRRNLRFD